MIIFYSLKSGFQSVLSVILNKKAGVDFDEKVSLHSFHDLFTSTSWLGLAVSIFSTILGQIAGFLADRQDTSYSKITFILVTGFNENSKLFCAFCFYYPLRPSCGLHYQYMDMEARIQ